MSADTPSARFAALRNLPRMPKFSLESAFRKPEAAPATPAAPAPAAPAPAEAPKKTKCKPNDPCFCGSHKKYKKCCMNAELSKIGSSPLAQVQEMMRKDKAMANTVRQMAEMFLTAEKTTKSAKK